MPILSVMLETVNPTSGKILINMAFPPPKYNRMWGRDYVLMDSKSFMGGISEEGYNNIVNLYSGLWNSYRYQVFNNLNL
jgi:hypothetical protein